MRRRLALVIALLLTSLFLPKLASAAPFIFGANQINQVVEIDLGTNTSRVVGSLPVGTQAIDQDPATGRLFFMERLNTGKIFGYWNPATRTTTVVHRYSPSIGIYAKRMAFAPNGTLYMMDKSNRLYTINKLTGALRSLGAVIGLPTGPVAGTGDMAFAHDGTLYVDDYQGIYTVNLSTRRATPLFLNLIPSGPGINVFSGLALCNGTLYASSAEEASQSSVMYSINPASGVIARLFTSVTLLNDTSSCPAF